MIKGARVASMNWKVKRGAFAATVFVGISAFAGAALAQTANKPEANAGQTTVNVSIAAGSLESAILAFGRQANIRLLYPTALTVGKTTRGVSGNLPAKAAVAQLLAGSGLVYSFTGPNTVRIYDRADQSARAGGVAADGSTVLEPLVIQGQDQGIKGVLETDGYVGKSGRSATKTDTPIAETPQSISTVSQKQLQDLRP